MSEKEQNKKVKLYRVLKVVFYCLGLPLFMFAVFTTCVKFVGHDPFVGAGGDMFGRYIAAISSPALYGIWVGAGIWAVIAAVQILFHFVIKNRRARMMATISVVLVVMLGTMLVMDSVFTNNLNSIAANAPAGVLIDDYKTELSYYNTVTTDVQSNTEKFMKKIQQLMDVYNVEFYGADKNGTAGNTANDAIYYDTIISDNGVIGVDHNGDGVIDNKDHYTVKESSLSFGNGETYSHYFSVVRNINGKDTYVWYTQDMMPEHRDGIFGKATYNQNGLFSDGWVPGIENVLKILSTYYGAEEDINAGIADKVYKSVDEARAEIRADALAAQTEFYENNDDPWLSALWGQEVEIAPNFSLTRSELNELIGVVGKMLGDNKLFDYLLKPDTGLSNIIWPVVMKLAPGIGLKELIGSSANSVIDTIAGLFSKEFIEQVPASATVSYDIQLVVRYKSDLYEGIEDPANKPDISGDDAFLSGKGTDSLYVLLRTVRKTLTGVENGTNVYEYAYDKEILEIDFGNPDTADGTAFLDRISALLNGVVNGLGLPMDTIKTVVDLVDGLGLIGIKLGDFFDSNNQFHIDITDLLMGLLDGFYWYQSPVIKPVYMFYVDEALEENEPVRLMQEAFMKYDMAYYVGAKYASMIGSTIIGDTLGGGSYPSSLGITSRAAADQLLTELSYKPTYYPLFGVRDMLEIFTGIVIFCTFISYIFAEKEFAWANGTVDPEELAKRKKRKKKGEKAEDDTALNVDENNDKEVK